MRMGPLLPVLLVAILSLADLCAAQQSAGDLAAETAPTRVLLEEAVLAQETLDIPADGEISLRLPQGTPEEVITLDGFKMDLRSGMFATVLVLNDGTTLGLRGQAVVLVPALVPLRRITPGEVIAEVDLVATQIPLARLSAGSLRSAEELLGKEVRRMLLPDRPVLAHSVMEPRVVRRGADVTISFSDGPIDLTAPGRVLEDGAQGQAVRVVNLSSNKTIIATVVRTGLVAVQ